MDTAGIICEFNPFHQGHRYLIEQVRKAGARRIVCIMSGCFVQRGQPAVSDKFERARSAVEGGADLILELPSVYAVNSADYFACGGVRILKQLGCVDTIAFGSECGDAAALKAAAMLEENSLFKDVLRRSLEEGMSYPASYSKAALSADPDIDALLLSSPNNTLAICYLRENIRQNAGLSPFTVRRTFPYSASDIRKNMASDKAVLEREKIFFALLRQKIADCSREEISNICEVTEGLENRIADALEKASDTDDLIKSIKSSRYTYAKISRILTQMLLGITKDIIRASEKKEIAYAKVLALNETGASVLKDARTEGRIPILSNINKNTVNDDIRPVLNIDINSSNLYSILCGRVINEYSDRVRIPIIMKI